MPSYAGTLENAKGIKDWFIMDIGFSSSSKSCGVYTIDEYDNRFTEDLSYGEMLRKFQAFVNGKTKIGLIIEAPLSVAFNNQIAKKDNAPLKNNGNPYGRKGIEMIETVDRYWYKGTGAMVTLSTINFLHEIKDLIVNKEIHFYEGFVSFKSFKEDEKQPTHSDDAIALYDALQYLLKNPPSKPYPSILENQTANATLQFIGDYVGITLANKTVPPVIKIQDIAKIPSSTTLHEQQLT